MPDRFYREVDLNEMRFYQLPKVLFENPKYSEMSYGAKLVYAILRDRQQLSMKNQWMDEEGRYFLIFTDEELANLVGASEKTVRKMKQECMAFELLYQKRLGQGQPNRLYILKLETVGGVENGKNVRSETVKSSEQEGQKLPCNDTDFKDTERMNQQQQGGFSFADDFFQTFGRYPSAMQLQEFNHYMDAGMENDLLSYAINKTGMAGANFLYCIGILKSWQKKGIFSLEQALEEEKDHQERKVQNEKHRPDSRSKQSDLYW